MVRFVSHYSRFVELFPTGALLLPAILTTLELFAICNLEHTAGFEPAVLLVCNQLHWASLPRVHNLEERRGIEPLFLG